MTVRELLSKSEKNKELVVLIDINGIIDSVCGKVEKLNRLSEIYMKGTVIIWYCISDPLKNRYKSFKNI